MSCCHHQTTLSDPQIQLPREACHSWPHTEDCCPFPRAQLAGDCAGTVAFPLQGSGSVCPKASLPALALAEVPQDIERRRQPCCPHRCKQARDRGSEGEATDLSFIPDCSMTEAHKSVKPKSVSTVPDISDIQAMRNSDQLHHPGAFSPGRLSAPGFVDAGWGTSSLACPWVG